MIIYRLDMHMKCLADTCDNYFVMKEVLSTPIHVPDIQAHLNKLVQDIPTNAIRCEKCNKATIDLSKIEIFTIRTIYGDESNGLWVCPDHTGKRYYPRPIEQAFKSHEKVGYSRTSGLMEASYKEIARRKFPWKCPICGKFLKYEVESNLGNFYT